MFAVIRKVYYSLWPNWIWRNTQSRWGKPAGWSQSRCTIPASSLLPVSRSHNVLLSTPLSRQVHLAILGSARVCTEDKRERAKQKRWRQTMRRWELERKRERVRRVKRMWGRGEERNYRQRGRACSSGAGQKRRTPIRGRTGREDKKMKKEEKER